MGVFADIFLGGRMGGRAKVGNRWVTGGEREG